MKIRIVLFLLIINIPLSVCAQKASKELSDLLISLCELILNEKDNSKTVEEQIKLMAPRVEIGESYDSIYGKKKEYVLTDFPFMYKTFKVSYSNEDHYITFSSKMEKIKELEYFDDEVDRCVKMIKKLSYAWEHSNNYTWYFKKKNGCVMKIIGVSNLLSATFSMEIANERYRDNRFLKAQLQMARDRKESVIRQREEEFRRMKADSLEKAVEERKRKQSLECKVVATWKSATDYGYTQKEFESFKRETCPLKRCSFAVEQDVFEIEGNYHIRLIVKLHYSSRLKRRGLEKDYYLKCRVNDEPFESEKMSLKKNTGGKNYDEMIVFLVPINEEMLKKKVEISFFINDYELWNYEIYRRLLS